VTAGGSTRATNLQFAEYPGHLSANVRNGWFQRVFHKGKAFQRDSFPR
jgi:hypothetical protein